MYTVHVYVPVYVHGYVYVYVCTVYTYTCTYTYYPTLSLFRRKEPWTYKAARGAVLALPGLKGLLWQWVEEGEVGGVASFQDWFKASGCFDSHSLADRVRSESAVQHAGCDRKDAVVTAEFFSALSGTGVLSSFFAMML